MTTTLLVPGIKLLLFDTIMVTPCKNMSDSETVRDLLRGAISIEPPPEIGINRLRIFQEDHLGTTRTYLCQVQLGMHSGDIGCKWYHDVRGVMVS